MGRQFSLKSLQYKILWKSVQPIEVLHTDGRNGAILIGAPQGYEGA